MVSCAIILMAKVSPARPPCEIIASVLTNDSSYTYESHVFIIDFGKGNARLVARSSVPIVPIVPNVILSYIVCNPNINI